MCWDIFQIIFKIGLLLDQNAGEKTFRIRHLGLMSGLTNAPLDLTGTCERSSQTISVEVRDGFLQW